MKFLKRLHCRLNGHKDRRMLIEKDGNPRNIYMYCAYCGRFHPAFSNDLKWPKPEYFVKLVN